MRNWTFAGALAASLCVVTPGSAAVTIAMTGNTATSGADANSLVINTNDNGVPVSVRITGWSIDSGGIVRDSYLGVYGNGLGVTSGDENGGNNTHVVDNQNRVDFLLFQFSKTVNLKSATFTTFNVNGLSPKDSDATIAYGNTGTNYLSQPALNEMAAATALYPLFTNSMPSAGTDVGGSRNLAPANWVGNLWLISAAQVNTDGKIDGFKLANLKFQTVAVPEPSTWAMMIAGFGLVGFGIRRRAGKRVASAA